MRALPFLLLLVCLPGCPEVKPPAPCGPLTCAGCCDATGQCQLGLTPNACGQLGASCGVCGLAQFCGAGRCQTSQPVDAGTVDAGADAGVDAGVIDGGDLDAGTVDCTVPSTLDFGVIATGSTPTLELVLDNPTTQLQEATVGAPSMPVFGVSPQGAVQVPPLTASRATVTFRPIDSRDSLATLAVRRAAGCPMVNVRLQGTSVSGVLSWAPQVADFGYVRPGTQSSLDLVFTNIGTAPVQLSNLAGSTAEFQVLSATSLVVPGRGTATVQLGFSPALPGPRVGQLRFDSDAFGQPMGVVSLRGVGGGPVISAPASLAFGQVPFPSGLARTLTVQNTGTRPMPADPRANLRLGSVVNGTPGTLPYFSVRALNATTTATEFTVAAAASYVPSLGVLGGDAVNLTVTLTPTSAGMKSAELTIFSNDTVTPALLVTLSATVTTFPACSYTVRPVTMNFGLVRPGTRLELPAEVTNTGATACTLVDAQVTGGSPVFSLAPFSQQVLSAGQATRVRVRATAPGLVTVPSAATGSLLLTTSSSSAPTTSVPLSATLATPCLTVPASVDLGTSALTCRVGPRTLTLFNTCVTSVTFSSATLTNALGVAGTEFLATLPANGTVIAPGTSQTLTVDYRPVDVGSDEGLLRLSVVQSGVAVDQLIVLTGTGSVSGLNTDTTARPAVEKADVLFVIDDSCSMSDKQLALSQTTAAFLQAGQSNANDFQLGVTNTELTDPSRGTLRRSPNGTAILKPTTPTLATQFAALVQVGLGGAQESCLEPATRALSDALRYDPARNLGFLRDDATLSVVCVTDARDQTPYTAAYELALLGQVKGLQQPHLLNYDVIGPFLPAAPAQCAYDDPNDATHATVVNGTNGIQEEICTTDWPAVMSRVAQRVFSAPARFYSLKRRPDLASSTPLTVLVNGVAVPQTNLGATVWSYDVVRNLVTFEPLYAPEPGSTVTVTYAGACF